MATQPTVILASGGIRSLVATAVLTAAAERHKLVMIHIKDGRANAPVRLEHLRKQADHYRVAKTIELELPHLQTEGFTHEKDEPGSPLTRPQMMLVALAQAIEVGASRLIWPVQVHGDYDTIARITEQLVLLQHLAQLECPSLPTIETPLLELTDAQMIELGGQLDVPWQLAWTCTIRNDQPCRICDACRRRHAAFEAAGVTDPLERPLAAR
jgi:7-cyano-7-deazaguanine synthase